MAAIVSIGLLDAATGVDLSLQILYLAPCSFVAWRIGRAWSLGLSTLSAAAWLGADLYSGHTYSHPLFAASNTLTLWIFLGVSSWMLSAMAAALARETMNARVDHLTGLWNVRAFHDLAEREMAIAKRDGSELVIAYLDLDDFKKVNATLGHLGADDVLRAVASALRRSLRSTDVIGRLGGDEFAIVLPRTSKAEARAVLGRTLESVIETTKWAGTAVSFSLGCIVSKGGAGSLTDLLRAADRTMYDAKSAGKSGLILTEMQSSLA